MSSEAAGSVSGRRGYDSSHVFQRRDVDLGYDSEGVPSDRGMMLATGKHHEENNTSVEAEKSDELDRKESSSLATEEVDEFGRLIPALKKPREKKPSIEYPPCFCETHAVEFALDARSGMFYHASSDFFYDPKSKLYYGNKQKLYYQFDDSLPAHRQFEALEQQRQDTASQSTLEPETLLESQRPPSSSSSKAISINLKTKMLPAKTKNRQSKHSRETVSGDSSTQADGATLSSLTSNQKKRHSESIEKWQERRQEREAAELAASTAASVITTKTGNPVCLLCKRKFQSLELLRRHEQESRMHKENVAKKSEQPAQYLDRAQSRRAMQRNTTPYSNALLTPVESFMDVPMVSDDTSFDPLGEQNIGRKLLLGMGGSDKGNSQTHESLSKEWDRIETSMQLRK